MKYYENSGSIEYFHEDCYYAHYPKWSKLEAVHDWENLLKECKAQNQEAFESLRLEWDSGNFAYSETSIIYIHDEWLQIYEPEGQDQEPPAVVHVETLGRALKALDLAAKGVLDFVREIL